MNITVKKKHAIYYDFYFVNIIYQFKSNINVNSVSKENKNQFEIIKEKFVKTKMLQFKKLFSFVL